jgi:hypothetical protein
MRKLMFITAICALLAAPAFADTVQVWQQAGYSFGNGGEFTAKPSGWSWNPLIYYDDSTSNIGPYDPSFQTFCVETSEFFSPGVVYNVTFGSNAMYGGQAPGGDPISVGTAWLYHEFQKQTLDGYDWDTTDGHRSADAGILQATIWYLEGEGGIPGNVKFLNQIPFGNPFADNAGQIPVLVMSLWDANWNAAQDMLVCVPIPAAVLLGILGFCVAGLKLRKFA